MTGLLGPREVRELAAQLGIHPAKALGQNFVVDPNTIRRIVRLADLPAGAHVLEIGPGLGSLTLGLLQAGHRVTAVEIDSRLAEQLPRTVADRLPQEAHRLTVITGDALRMPEVGTPSALVANLPYNVAVPVLMTCLAQLPSLASALVMVQVEVADRLAAGPGSRIYGVPSVKAAWYGSARRVGTVSPAVFWPVPRVDSGLVDLRSHVESGVLHRGQSREAVFGLVDLLFGQRRKTIRHTLATAFGPTVSDSALALAGLDASMRPEQMALGDFVGLAEALALER